MAMLLWFPNRIEVLRLATVILSFQIQNTTAGNTPTALGNNQYLTLVGQLTINDATTPPTTTDVVLKTPEGINMETVVYPYVQTSLGLLYGTELVAKYSPKTQLKM